MIRLTKTETFFSNLNLTCGDELFVGVDVHKKSYHVAMFLNDASGIDFNMAGMARKLAGHLWAMLMKNQPYDPQKAKSKGI